MKNIKTILFSIMAMTASLLFCIPEVFGYGSTFHGEITKRAVEESKIEKSSYLQKNLGISPDDSLDGPTAKGWIAYGSIYEDMILGDIILGVRSLKHFYDPYYNMWPSLNRARSLWRTSRRYFYEALTFSSKTARDKNMAAACETLGRVVHLLEDMAVPVHTRLDIHPPFNPDFYEDYWKGKSLPPATARVLNSDRVENFWDSDNGAGLAEYTNYNFLSDDTIFIDKYPHPNKNNTNFESVWNATPEVVQAEDGLLSYRRYVRPIGGIYAPDKLAAVGYFTRELVDVFSIDDIIRDSPLSYVYTLSLQIDEPVSQEYGSHLIPQAISYSAGLIDYFFRGELEVDVSDNKTQMTVTNRTGEPMISGRLELYYEKSDGTRLEIPEYEADDAGVDLNNLSLNDGESITLNFSPIFGKGDYILVYRGQLGNEQDGVIGKVFDATFSGEEVIRMMRAINRLQVIVNCEQKIFYNSTTNSPLGVPDSGINAPRLDVLDGYPFLPQYIHDLRNFNTSNIGDNVGFTYSTIYNFWDMENDKMFETFSGIYNAAYPGYTSWQTPNSDRNLEEIKRVLRVLTHPVIFNYTPRVSGVNNNLLVKTSNVGYEDCRTQTPLPAGTVGNCGIGGVGQNCWRTIDGYYHWNIVRQYAEFNLSHIIFPVDIKRAEIIVPRAGNRPEYIDEDFNVLIYSSNWGSNVDSSDWDSYLLPLINISARALATIPLARGNIPINMLNVGSFFQFIFISSHDLNSIPPSIPSNGYTANFVCTGTSFNIDSALKLILQIDINEILNVEKQGG